MKTQKEILLVTGATFSDRKLFKANVTEVWDGKQQLLEEVYKSVVLYEILHDMVEDCTESNNLSLLFVRQGQSFLQFELSEGPLVIEREYSLDPYLLLSAQIYN